MAAPNRIRVDNVRLSFNDLFVAKSVNGGEARFSAHLLLAPSHPQLEAMRRIALEQAEAKWPGKGKVIVSATEGTDKFFLRDGKTKPEYGGYEGMLFVSANTKKRPLVIDRDRTPLTQADGRPYSGCYVNASIEIYAFKHQTGGNQINAELIAVQFLRDGDAFGGGAPASADEFEDLATDEESLV